MWDIWGDSIKARIYKSKGLKEVLGHSSKDIASKEFSTVISSAEENTFCNLSFTRTCLRGLRSINSS